MQTLSSKTKFPLKYSYRLAVGLLSCLLAVIIQNNAATIHFLHISQTGHVCIAKHTAKPNPDYPLCCNQEQSSEHESPNHGSQGHDPLCCPICYVIHCLSVSHISSVHDLFLQYPKPFFRFSIDDQVVTSVHIAFLYHNRAPPVFS